MFRKVHIYFDANRRIAALVSEKQRVLRWRPGETRPYKLFQVKWLARKARWRSSKSAARLENHAKY
jgi:hypothetical protein